MRGAENRCAVRRRRPNRYCSPSSLLPRDRLVGRSLPRHLASYTHMCPILGRPVGLQRAIRWSPVSRRPARPRPPCCPICGQALELEGFAYQTAATEDWDDQLERTHLILEALTATDRQTN